MRDVFMKILFFRFARRSGPVLHLTRFQVPSASSTSLQLRKASCSSWDTGGTGRFQNPFSACSIAGCRVRGAGDSAEKSRPRGGRQMLQIEKGQEVDGLEVPIDRRFPTNR